MTNDDCLFFYHLSSFVSICPLRNDLRYAACCSSCHDCLQFCSDINHDHCCSDINHDRPPAINCSSCHASPRPSVLSLYCTVMTGITQCAHTAVMKCHELNINIQFHMIMFTFEEMTLVSLPRTGCPPTNTGVNVKARPRN